MRRSHHALAHFASHRCGPSSIPGLGRGRMCEKFHQLLAVGQWLWHSFHNSVVNSARWVEQLMLINLEGPPLKSFGPFYYKGKQIFCEGSETSQI